MADGVKFTDYYKILYLKPDAPSEEIRRHYLKLAKKYHPDMGGTAQKMRLINEAYKTLKDDSLRAEYDLLYTKYQEYLDGGSQDEKLYDEITQELYLIHQVKLTARSSALKGFAWLAIGTLITGITYAIAKPGGTYFLSWGAIIFGGYQFLRGMYFYFNPYALLKKAMGDKTPINYRKKAQGVRALVKVSGLAIVLILLGCVIGGMISNSSGGSANTNNNSLEGNRLQSLKGQYNQCTSELSSLEQQVNDVNSQMDSYGQSNDTYDYNALVPEQNSLADSYNAKRTECGGLRDQYNKLADSYNSELSQ